MKPTFASRSARRFAVGAASGILPALLLAGHGTWTSIGPHAVGNILLVAASPATPGMLYAATATVLFRSSDAGRSWTALPIPPAVTAFAADSRSAGSVYAGISFSGGVFNPEAGAVYRSTDGGAHWSSGSGIRASVLSLAVDPGSPAIVYAGTTEGLFHSMDAGASWSFIGAGLAVARVSALALESGVVHRLYAAGDGGVYASTDGGATWTAGAGFPPLPVTALASDPHRAGTVYAATNGAGVFRSADGGASWTAASLGLADSHVFLLALDPSSSPVLYAGGNGGVFRSTDGASSWTAANDGLPAPFIAALAVDPASPGTVYASVLGPGLFTASFSTRAARGVGFR